MRLTNGLSGLAGGFSCWAARAQRAADSGRSQRRLLTADRIGLILAVACAGSTRCSRKVRLLAPLSRIKPALLPLAIGGWRVERARKELVGCGHVRDARRDFHARRDQGKNASRRIIKGIHTCATYVTYDG